ncbi:hypothetical protein EDB89DRAFT_2229256 [Lactarius sanguifluus]|nr:hypothetical protein EDB89DRAFT_2229256 [Lactarius sanguifluus]
MDRKRWAELIRPFSETKWLYIAFNLSTEVALSLQLSRKRRKTLLPFLHKLCIREPEPHHEHLREAVMSLMVSCWLSDHNIAVEYERPWTNEFSGKGKDKGITTFSQQLTIEALSDDVLLNIFRCYLCLSPQFWPTLTHICRRWRQIVLGSPLGLRLRLYCTYGTPVLETLDCWPHFPLVLNYGGSPMRDPPALEDEENIMAALKQSNRVDSISLTVTNSLLENLSTVKEPISELEELVLLSRDNLKLTLPVAFRSGPRLRKLHLTRIAIPALLLFLSPSTGLVNLQLHEIPNFWVFLPMGIR